MKLPKSEFIRLQKAWHKKLAGEGFKDIERLKGDDWVLTETSSNCYGRIGGMVLAIKQEYYRWIAQIVLDEETKFRNDVDRYILTRHAEGARIKLMVTELMSRGTPRNRNSIRFIIRRYERDWGLRKWSLKQLNIKIKA